jgi:acyl-phosphate glycerol 3-phosphate acyltransferase
MPIILLAVILAVFLVGYALGCFNSAYYLTKWRYGADVRELHTGTAGATNAGRIGGKKLFAAAMLLDALKGAIATGVVWLWVFWSESGFVSDGDRFIEGGFDNYRDPDTLFISDFLGLIALFGAVVGHIFPVQLRFRGGKGLATTWGGMWIISWQTTVVMSVVAIAAKLLKKKLFREPAPETSAPRDKSWRRDFDGWLILIAYPIMAFFLLDGAAPEVWQLRGMVAVIALLMLANYGRERNSELRIKN